MTLPTLIFPLPPKPSAFVLLSCAHGTMIVNKNDVTMVSPTAGCGVGWELFQLGAFSTNEISLLGQMLLDRKSAFGNGVVALDCGANIGTHTIVLANFMVGWGSVIAFEPQERIYYALAGNLAINNCFNATARYCGLGANVYTTTITEPNSFAQCSFGSFGMSGTSDFVNQPQIQFTQKQVPVVSIDSLDLARVDLIKIDCEGMEIEVLIGASQIITRDHPILFIEVIKSDRADIEGFLKRNGYEFIRVDINLLAIHIDDPAINRIKPSDD
jgi:FkbM family methyltransferase